MDKTDKFFQKAVQYINTALKGDIEVKDVIRKVDIGNDEFKLLKDSKWILEWPGNETLGRWHIGLSGKWDTVLSKIVFGTENENGSEVAGDLIKEFVSNLLDDIVRSEQNLKQKNKKKTLKLIKPAELKKDDGLNSYTLLQIIVEGKIDSESNEYVTLTIILAIPPDIEVDDNSQETGSIQGKRGNIMSENDAINGKKVEFEEFSNDSASLDGIQGRNIEILKDVEMNISVGLGRNELPLGEILQLVKGSVVALDKMAGEPVEVLVNGFRIAQGEVVVIDEHFGVRITGLVSERERMKSLG